nr:hypothetical protein HK105_006100 [Polyrhizophydium stewartii]
MRDSRPTITIIGVCVLTAIASLLLLEASTKFPGNEGFQRNIELTVLVHQRDKFYGRSWYYVMIFILYGSLASTNIASIVSSAQVFDNMLITIFGGTCGIGITPIGGLYCVTAAGAGNSPFDGNIMFGTLGLLLHIIVQINLLVIIPMTLTDINSNILMQLLSALYMGLFTITVIYQAAATGLRPAAVKAIGAQTSGLIGTVLFNFGARVHPKVNVKRAIWMAVTMSCAMYILIGIFGALAFVTDNTTNVLQAMYSNKILTSFGKGWMLFVYITFPIMTYITSVPVAMIVVRLNFLAARICSKNVANFWALYAPFLIAIPFQTGSAIQFFSLWTSLTFQSLCNFIAPFLIFMFLSKLLAQSVIDELEFLDINAGIKKTIRDDEDDFDYIYHLPFADPSRIIPRDPFAKVKEKTKESELHKHRSEMSLAASYHSLKAVRSLVDASHGEINKAYKKVVQSSRTSLNNLASIHGNIGGSQANMKSSRGNLVSTSNANLSTNFGPSLGIDSTLHRNRTRLGTTTSRQESTDGSKASNSRGLLGLYGNLAPSNRTSTYRSGQVAPTDDLDDNAYSAATYKVVKPFKALPRWLTEIIRPQWVAGLCAIVMAILVADAIVLAATSPPA